MMSVNINGAKTHLSRLVEDASHVKPMVKVIPFPGEDQTDCRRLGFMQGEIQVP